MMKDEESWLEEEWLGNWMEGSGGWNGAHMDVKEECDAFHFHRASCPLFLRFASLDSRPQLLRRPLKERRVAQVGADAAHVACDYRGCGENIEDRF